MEKPLRDGEIRIIIKPADAPADSARLIPARVFQKTFNTVLHALKTADTELHDKAHRSEFLISDLRMGSNVVAFYEQPRSTEMAIDALRHVAGAVYRSEFERLAENSKLAKSVVAIGSAIDVNYPALAMFQADTIPLDGFFAKQAERLHKAMGASGAKSRFFAGTAIGAFDGTLGDIDYRGATWTGHLVLPGTGAQIECVFDRSKGEDAFNPFGNKRVSITGRAIYTGDRQLPERIEVVGIEEIPLAQEAIDIRGTLTGKRYFGVRGSREGKNLQ
jgi:hypothetical protein